MMGRSHAPAGTLTWFGVSAALAIAPAYTDAPLPELDVFQVVYGAVMAGATAHDWLSPDADRHPILGRLIPGGHRGPLHTPEIVAAISALLLWLSWDSPAAGTSLAVAVGWMSHVLADAVFGEVPWLIAGGRRHGLGLDTDGVFERCVVRPLLAPAACLAGAFAIAASAGLPAVEWTAAAARWAAASAGVVGS
jgi:membrane-bound metal-dependent hydrolase YbcI (DUF457 family)